MGLLTWLTDRWNGTPRPPGDDDDLVPVANVRAFQAPMIEQVLADGSISCSVIDEHAASTWEPMRRILVRRIDVAEAERLLADFHAR